MLRATTGVVRGLQNGQAYTFTVVAQTDDSAVRVMSAPSRPVVPHPAVRVDRGTLVDDAAVVTRLLGVNLSGPEYACRQPVGNSSAATRPGTSAPLPDLGPMLPAGQGPPVAAIVAWHATAVRLPLNEDCWLGINDVSPARGAAYRRAIEGYVEALNAAGLVVIVDLHWNAPGDVPADGQQLMADANHAPRFWQTVAVTLHNLPGVVFDLYNEPDLSASQLVPRGDPWRCWLRGCTVSSRLTAGASARRWRAVGMQELIDTIRSARAPQPIMLGGLANASQLRGLPLARLRDDVPGRGRQLIASFHAYWYGEHGSKCGRTLEAACSLANQERRWRHELASFMGRIPVVTGELGEFDCTSTYVNRFMDWADARGISYLAWAWVPASCAGYPALIESYDGTPTPFGAGVRSHLGQEAARLVAALRGRPASG